MCLRPCLEIVQFQIFLDDCYETFRRDVPADPEHPEVSEPIRHALWARENYYRFPKTFFINQTFGTKLLAHRWDTERFLFVLWKRWSKIKQRESVKECLVRFQAFIEEG